MQSVRTIYMNETKLTAYRIFAINRQERLERFLRADQPSFIFNLYLFFESIVIFNIIDKLMEKKNVKIATQNVTFAFKTYITQVIEKKNFKLEF